MNLSQSLSPSCLAPQAGSFRWLFYLVLALGSLQRLLLFLPHNDLSHDESAYSIALLNSSYKHLLTLPLDNNQAAPILFTLLTKASVDVFGESEYALRSVSLLCSLLTPFLFYGWLNRFPEFPPLAKLFGLTCISFCPTLLTYTALAKPYSGDIFATLLIVLLLHSLPDLTPRQLVLRFLLLCPTLFLSYASVFVLFSLGSGTILLLLLQSKWRRSIYLALFFGALAAVFWVNQTFFIYSSTIEKMQDIWVQARFFGSGKTNREYLGQLWHFASELLTFRYPILVNSLLLISIGKLFRKPSQPLQATLLVLLFLIPISVSSLGYYPYVKRLWIFLIPPLVILLTFGFTWLIQKSAWLPIPATLLLIWVSLNLYDLGKLLTSRLNHQGWTQLMKDLTQNRSLSGPVWVHHFHTPMWKIYDRWNHYSSTHNLNLIGDSDFYLDESQCKERLDQLKTLDSFWILVPYTATQNATMPPAACLHYLAPEFLPEIIRTNNTAAAYFLKKQP